MSWGLGWACQSRIDTRVIGVPGEMFSRSTSLAWRWWIKPERSFWAQGSVCHRAGLRPHSLAILKLSGKAAVLRPPGNLSGWDPTSQQLSCHQLLQGEMTPSGQTPAPSPREVPPAPGGAVEALGSAGGVSAASPLPEKELADTADSREHLLGMLRHVQESLEAAEAPERCGRRSQGKIWELRFFCDLFFFLLW